MEISVTSLDNFMDLFLRLFRFAKMATSHLVMNLFLENILIYQVYQQPVHSPS